MDPEQLSHGASLCLSLAGFSLSGGDEGQNLAAGPPAPRPARPAVRTKATPCVSAGPLITHLEEVVTAALERSRDLAADDEVCQKVSSLCFAVASTVGAGKLAPEEEERLWTLSTALWVRRHYSCRRRALLPPCAFVHCRHARYFHQIAFKNSHPHLRRRPACGAAPPPPAPPPPLTHCTSWALSCFSSSTASPTAPRT
jgi:hypothetical protein